MASAYAKILRHSWCRSFRLAALMLLAGAAPALGVTDADFVKSELTRLGSAHLSENQKQAINLAERYRRQKNAQKKLPAPVPVASGNVPAFASSANGKAPATVSRTDIGLRGNYSLTRKDCVRMLAADAEKKVRKADVASAQLQLRELGFDPDWIDGLLGPRTRAALKAYCRINEVYPDWPQTLAGNVFVKWAEGQPDREEIGKTMRSGNAGEVIALLARYEQRKNSSPHSWTPEDLSVSYTLTKQDFELLKSPDEVLKRIGKLKGETYASEDKFRAALEAALKGLAATEQYINVIVQNVAQEDGSKLTDQSFADLVANGVPGHVQQAVMGLKGVAYPGNELEAAVKNALDNLSGEVMQFRPKILALAKISPTGASFTDDSLKEFSDKYGSSPLAPVILGKLQNMKIVQYQNDKSMAKALGNVLGQVEKEIGSYATAIVDSAESAEGFGLSEEAMPAIKEQLDELSIPPVYLELMADLQDADYPDADLLWAAMQAKVSMAGSNNPFRKKIFTELERNLADEVNKALLDKLKAAAVPPGVLAKLAELQGCKFKDTKSLEAGVSDVFANLSGKEFPPSHTPFRDRLETLQGCLLVDASKPADTRALKEEEEKSLLNAGAQKLDQFHPQLIEQGRKVHPFDKSAKIQWSGEACNCVHNNLSGQVYGFYPYWMAGGKQEIDFSVLNRVGYFGLSFDDKGNIANPSRWSELDTDFIREARKYGSKADLVIYRNDWKTWSLFSAEEKKEAFEKLAGNIVELAEIPLTDLFSRVKPYLSMGTHQATIMGDGVTLYFDGYPQDQESVDAFGAFIRTLTGTLKAHKRNYFVNIMFRSSEMGQGIYDYQKLLETMDDINGESRKSNGYFLVMLQEPTTRDKKDLRQKIENGLHGKDRMKLLRNVVMALTYDGHDEAQLTDDVIYAKDNFGGIGFWPQPVLSASSVNADIRTALHGNFVGAVNGVVALPPAVCQIVCPNRWAFRIAWDISILALATCVFLYFWACTWRTFMTKNFMYFIAGVVAPAFLISIALLFCDPAWEEISRGNGLLILVIMAVIGYSIWNYQENKRKADLP